jgi:LytS/YehU family sensor histidine kinase
VHIAEPFYRTDFEQESLKEIFTDAGYLFGVYFPVVFMYAFIMLIIKSIKRRFEEKHQIEILKKEKVTNELKFLRAQIQPHFLFNTLNNLYALTLAKSDVAPKVVLKLSELLDFILYQSNEKSISVQKEIELIKGFIDLEKLRFGSRIKVEFSHNIENKNSQISPLLLLPLVENAFKHGPTGNEKNVKIQIDLNVKNNILNFEILNNKPIIAKTNNLHNGIGIKNLKRQLTLNYKNNFKLEVEDLDDEYKVNLKIDLN